jgi:hypothetical protein
VAARCTLAQSPAQRKGKASCCAALALGFCQRWSDCVQPTHKNLTGLRKGTIMEDIIKEAVAAAFDTDDLCEAVADVVADLIDYNEIARELSRRPSFRDAVHDAAADIAEALL